MSEWVTTCNERPEWLKRQAPDTEPEKWHLTIVWSGAEPERIGESVMLEEQAGNFILGRGDATAADPTERLQFVRSRPTGIVTTPPLRGGGLSRRQCRVSATRNGVTFENIGRAQLMVQGKLSNHALLRAGDLVTIQDQLILRCSRQPALPRLHYFNPKLALQFGLADSFGIVGEHHVTWELREQLAFCAAAKKHVLLLGESGSGKELAARALHRLSSRATKPMITRNAATFPASLIDAELFGNAPDYPTSGTPLRQGMIGQVDGSTLFLDELAELPLELQAHLLRVLDQGGEYQRLGDPVVRSSEFCLIGATNHDPTELRTDILGRLALQVQLPSLADRVEDIPLLVRHLLLKAADTLPDVRNRLFVDSAQGPQPRIDPLLMQALLQHRYTNNVRELEALLWKATANSPREFLELSQALRGEFVHAPPSIGPLVCGPAAAAEPTAEELTSALSRQGGNVAKTASALGLKSRYALYRLMRKHGISVEQAR